MGVGDGRAKRQRLVRRTEDEAAVLHLPSSATPQPLLPHLQGKATTERNLEAKWASDPVRAAQALRHGASGSASASSHRIRTVYVN